MDFICCDDFIRAQYKKCDFHSESIGLLFNLKTKIEKKIKNKNWSFLNDIIFSLYKIIIHHFYFKPLSSNHEDVDPWEVFKKILTCDKNENQQIIKQNINFQIKKNEKKKKIKNFFNYNKTKKWLACSVLNSSLSSEILLLLRDREKLCKYYRKDAFILQPLLSLHLIISLQALEQNNPFLLDLVNIHKLSKSLNPTLYPMNVLNFELLTPSIKSPLHFSVSSSSSSSSFFTPSSLSPISFSSFHSANSKFFSSSSSPFSFHDSSSIFSSPSSPYSYSTSYSSSSSTSSPASSPSSQSTVRKPCRNFVKMMIRSVVDNNNCKVDNGNDNLFREVFNKLLLRCQPLSSTHHLTSSHLSLSPDTLSFNENFSSSSPSSISFLSPHLSFSQPILSNDCVLINNNNLNKINTIISNNKENYDQNSLSNEMNIVNKKKKLKHSKSFSFDYLLTLTPITFFSNSTSSFSSSSNNFFSSTSSSSFASSACSTDKSFVSSSSHLTSSLSSIVQNLEPTTKCLSLFTHVTLTDSDKITTWSKSQQSPLPKLKITTLKSTITTSTPKTTTTTTTSAITSAITSATTLAIISATTSVTTLAITPATTTTNCKQIQPPKRPPSHIRSSSDLSWLHKKNFFHNSKELENQYNSNNLGDQSLYLKDIMSYQHKKISSDHKPIKRQNSLVTQATTDGSSLIHFFSSHNFSCCTDMDRENAHFNFAETLLTVIEQIKWKYYVKSYYGNQSITNKKALKNLNYSVSLSSTDTIKYKDDQRYEGIAANDNDVGYYYSLYGEKRDTETQGKTKSNKKNFVNQTDNFHINSEDHNFCLASDNIGLFDESIDDLETTPSKYDSSLSLTSLCSALDLTEPTENEIQNDEKNKNFDYFNKSNEDIISINFPSVSSSSSLSLSPFPSFLLPSSSSLSSSSSPTTFNNKNILEKIDEKKIIDKNSILNKQHSYLTSSSSADIIALNLIKKFKDFQSHQFNWIVSEKDTPQKMLPLPHSIPISPVEDSLMNKMRGNVDWAPPRPQIISIVHKKLKPVQALARQNNRCAGCGDKIDPICVWRCIFCEYTGKYFCNCCHLKEKSLVPGRILTSWDFKSYFVSHFAKKFLDQNMDQPWFIVKESLVKKVDHLSKIKKLRLQIFHLNNLLSICNQHPQQQNSSHLISSLPSHWFSSLHAIDSYSLNELISVKKKEMLPILKEKVKLCIDHVNDCYMCKARGFTCEICKKPEILFPFQLHLTSTCQVCRNTYHKKCFDPKACPKCSRISQRKKLKHELK